jgi:Kinesin motor domain
VFDSLSTQSDVYSHALTPLLERFFEGSDCLLFAYGTANSGKSYTIQGTHSNPGLLPTLVEEILEVADRMSDVGDCELKVTMLEIYQEKIHDLLSEKKEKLSLRDVNGRLEVSRLSSHVLSSMGGAIALMERAASKRYNCCCQLKGTQSE